VPLLSADRVQESLRRVVPFRMEADVPPRFKPGDRVRTRNIHPTGHTRLPRYARGRLGAIARDHGVFVFADASGEGRGKIPQRLYSVRFTARELWGPEASPRDSIHIDLWDAHLDPA
jgi:nitrile hydratase subunit beta